jgi:hypothetical protein
MMNVPGFGFVPVDRLFASITGQQLVAADPQAQPQVRSGPYRGPRPSYYAGGGQPAPTGYGPGYDPSAPPPGSPYQPPPPPQPPHSAADQFRDAISLVQTVVDMADRFRPQEQAAPPPPPPEPEKEVSHIQVIDTGPAKLVLNRADGTARFWETSWANMDKVLKWVGDQREAIQKSQNERETRQAQAAAPPRALPQGYVEVVPGYQPPPGYVVGPPVDPRQIPQTYVQVQPVPVQQQPQQQPLPEPPAQMPPPITEEPKRRTWGMPPIPGGG